MRDDILLRVEKPARYIGNEINMVKKNPENVDIRFAFCFPDVYEVGMSHVGLQILYYFFNNFLCFPYNALKFLIERMELCEFSNKENYTYLFLCILSCPITFYFD